MARIIELKGESDLSLKQVTAWLSKLAGELASEVPLVVEAQAATNGDEVSLKIRIGPCGGKVGPPFFTIVPVEGDQPEDARLNELTLEMGEMT